MKEFKRFRYAFNGFKALLVKDHNFLLHLIISILVIVLGFIFQLNRYEWLFILLSIFLVLTLEALNTAIEFVVDLVTLDYHEFAKYAKDIAAFSVMLVSIFAIITGLIIFIPHIFS
ncbi:MULTISPECIES: diacylglycerol kinase family protein [Staphylococcus]|uniref:diacylglycerol kinase family protein n=1 Tax=Staphylococcus TaxID=1279 RepID=UPI0009B6F7A9|nr:MULTISPECIES: diacylglycerol kinase family protein [Staphylococcus]ARB77686.1 diacylglycerol kinase [Staphylococcus lugdunensis]ARJ18803.1 diacylglycerol kinase [Staphylococcus lugdunensis]MBM7133629.1 diacylglycerol kinase family protein [Staphylococcus lugdunensis]MCH8642491.1 diacylglycerol kinase family protein [Staphylococcus lugdunensis]MCH8643807.1 diacylglycerol kinase family protein [Staphylococcus lugdunensis]